ncbi:polyprotein [Bienertia sinuspersici]
MLQYEVTNTPWGERVSFVFNPNSDTVAKALHVSPFMDMEGNWKIKATAPGDDLSVAISVQHPSLGDYFCAMLRAQKVASWKGPDHILFFWLMPHKVAVWIYWHVSDTSPPGSIALKLWWKSVTFVQHPRYTNPAYREEVVLRDKGLNCCKAAGNSETNGLCPGDVRDEISHQFSWADAKWPWS